MLLALCLDETSSSWKSDYVFEAISTVNIKSSEKIETGSHQPYVLPITKPNIIIDTTILLETKIDS